MSRPVGRSAVEGSIRIPIVGLACSAGDGPALERALKGLRGVIEVYVNCVTDTVYLDVEHEEFSALEAAHVLESFGTRDIRRRVRTVSSVDVG